MAKVFLIKDYDPVILLNTKYCIQREFYLETPVLAAGNNLGEAYQWGQEGDCRCLSISDLIELEPGLFIIMPIGFKAVKWGDTVNIPGSYLLSKTPPQVQVDYFKREQRKGIFHYVKVVGGPGKTKDGYQKLINFLNNKPIIKVEFNDIINFTGTGTWYNYEVDIPITKEEYREAFEKATANGFQII